MNLKTKAIAAIFGLVCIAAGVLDRAVVNAAYLQVVFTQTADDCRAAQKAWSKAHSSAKDTATQCFMNAKPIGGRSSMPPYFFQAVSTSTPLAQPAGAAMTLTFKALGPAQLAKDQAGANPKPAGEGQPAFYEMLVFSGPTPGQDAAYNDWYDHQHVPDVTRNSGFISGQRFILTDADQGKALQLPPYLVLFTLNSADLKATEEEINARIRDGRTRMSPAFDGKSGGGLFGAPL